MLPWRLQVNEAKNRRSRDCRNAIGLLRRLVSGDLVQVDSFTVLSEGVAHTFIPEEGGFSIPLPHLRDHLRSGEAVEVVFVEVDGVLIASDVVDADSHR